MSAPLDYDAEARGILGLGSGPLTGFPAHQCLRLCTVLRLRDEELSRTQAALAALRVPLCIGQTTIERLRKEGMVQFDSGHALIAADDLFQPTAVEALTAERDQAIADNATIANAVASQAQATFEELGKVTAERNQLLDRCHNYDTVERAMTPREQSFRETIATLTAERDEWKARCHEAREQVGHCHTLISRQRAVIDPELHKEVDDDTFTELEPCDRLFDENESLKAAVQALTAERDTLQLANGSRQAAIEALSSELGKAAAERDRLAAEVQEERIRRHEAERDRDIMADAVMERQNALQADLSRLTEAAREVVQRAGDEDALCATHAAIDCCRCDCALQESLQRLSALVTPAAPAAGKE